MVRDGAIFQTTTDSEVILHLYARSKASTAEGAIIEALSQVRGAFSLTMMTKDKLNRRTRSARIPSAGARPSGRGARRVFGDVRARFDRSDLRAGHRARRGVHRGTFWREIDQAVWPAPLAHCVFEHVYFADPTATCSGRSVNEVRTELGRLLAREQPADADVVVPVPDSGVCAAVGFSAASSIPLRMGLIRNSLRRAHLHRAATVHPALWRAREAQSVKSILAGQRVVLVDDSIVRGTTSRKIVKIVRAAGAREVHMRISCPPTISPCFYGVDTPQRSELIGATHTLEEICKYIEADSLGI